jgi:ABC-2 type transport system ATP-binding protein
VGLAQAILHRPDLLILDEPTEGLDPNQRVEIRRLVQALGRDRTVVLSTHVLPEVQHVCSRLLVIHRGQLAADGSVEELTAQAAGAAQVHVEAEGEGVVESLGALPGVRDTVAVRAVGSRVGAIVTTDGTADVRPAIFALARDRGWTLYELHQEARSLEELFRQLTTEGAA